MALKLSEVIAKVRQVLRDQFATIPVEWTDAQITAHIESTLKELSRVSSYQTKETKTTTSGSKDIDISAITNLLYVDRVEFRVDQNPKEFRNFEVWGNTLTMDISSLPGVEDAYLYCAKIHTLTEAASTLSPFQEDLLIKGVAIQAATVNARKDPSGQIERWGANQWGLYQRELIKLKKLRIWQEYSKD